VLIILVSGALAFFGFVALMAAVLGLGTSVEGGSRWGGDKIAVIDVSGMIVSGSGGGGIFGSGAAGAQDIIKQLAEARKDDSTKAVILRIDSPGGSAAASEEIYQAAKEVRDLGKPVVASMSDVAASGGYYVAAAANKIVADASTLTGSIGVIMHMADLTSLYKKVGYQPVTIKSGKHKDLGSSSRPMTAEERQMFQALLDDVHDQFITCVAEGRGWPKSKVKVLADGRIFSGRQAQKLGLVDEIGTFSTAVRLTAKLAGIHGEPALVRYGRKSMLEQLMATSAAAAGRSAAATLAERLEPRAVEGLLSHPGL